MRHNWVRRIAAAVLFLIAAECTPEKVCPETYEHAPCRAMQYDLFEMRAAITRYKADHGRCPTTLDQLVPGYLRKIPPDPVTKSRNWGHFGCEVHSGQRVAAVAAQGFLLELEPWRRSANRLRGFQSGGEANTATCFLAIRSFCCTGSAGMSGYWHHRTQPQPNSALSGLRRTNTQRPGRTLCG
jgi:hypothetical protein